MFLSSIRRSRFRRGAALLTSLAFVWTGVAAPFQALALPHLANGLAKPDRPNRPAKRVPPPKSLKENLPPLTPAQLHARLLHPTIVRQIPTLLDEVGKLVRNVSEEEVGGWKSALHTPHSPARETAKAHIQLGEYLLARKEDPEGALWHFRAASALAAPDLRGKSARTDLQTLKSLAAFDTALTHLLQGRYVQASDELRSLFARRGLRGGFDSRNAALLRRHADACVGYHAQRRRAGITEPVRLDPFCGMEALAACLRGSNRPYDKPTVQAAVPMTGFGSDMADIEVGARKLGMSPHKLTADETALQALPKPLVAFVEHDCHRY